MSNLTVTWGGAWPTVAAGIFATAALAGSIQPTSQEIQAAISGSRHFGSYEALRLEDSGPSGGEISVGRVGEDFEQEIARFYDRLLANQTPLGAEFEAVLAQNLWDLYAE